MRDGRARARRRARGAAAVTTALLARSAVGLSGTCATDDDFSVTWTAQRAGGGTFACCSSTAVIGVQFRTRALTGQYDPMDWVVVERDESASFAATECNVSLATTTSMSCIGSACDGTDPNSATCFKKFLFPGDPATATSRCLRGVCQLPPQGNCTGVSGPCTHGNSQCNSNVNLEWIVASSKPSEGKTTDEKEKEAATLGGSIGGAAVFVLILFFLRRIFGAVNWNRRQAVQSPHPQQPSPAPMRMPQPQQPPSPSPSPYQPTQPSAPTTVVIPGQRGARDTILVLQQPQQQAAAERTVEEQYYPSV